MESFLSIYFSSQSYGHYSAKNGSFFVFSADDSKKSVTVLAKYVSASKKSYLALLQKML